MAPFLVSGRNEGTKVISLQETTIDSTIATTRFSCDLARCKGACCTMPGPKGAPLLPDEVEEINKALPVVRKYLSQDHLRCIDEHGPVLSSIGGLTTTCYNFHACVFVTYEEGIAKCAFEKAYFKKELSWRKPFSCHLFPIRIDQGLHTHLRYESIPECQPALHRGQQDNVFLSDFLKDSLTRVFGKLWYQDFDAECSDERQRLTNERSQYTLR
jgi:hypothetical protein